MICAQYFRMTLEFIQYLGTSYPLDAKKQPTRLKMLLDNLKQKNIKFPAQTLTKPFEGITRSQINPRGNNNQGQQQKPMAQTQNIPSKPQKQSFNKDDLIQQITELQISITEDAQMIYETLTEGEGEMDYVNEVLETYSKTIGIVDKKLDKALTQALEHDNVLQEDHFNQLQILKNFTEQFPILYKQFIDRGKSQTQFNILKNSSIRLAGRVLGKEIPDDDRGGNQFNQASQIQQRQAQQKVDEEAIRERNRQKERELEKEREAELERERKLARERDEEKRKRDAQKAQDLIKSKEPLKSQKPEQHPSLMKEVEQIAENLLHSSYEPKNKQQQNTQSHHHPSMQQNESQYKIGSKKLKSMPQRKQRKVLRTTKILLINLCNLQLYILILRYQQIQQEYDHLQDQSQQFRGQGSQNQRSQNTPARGQMNQTKFEQSQSHPSIYLNSQQTNNRTPEMGYSGSFQNPDNREMNITNAKSYYGKNDQTPTPYGGQKNNNFNDNDGRGSFRPTSSMQHDIDQEYGQNRAGYRQTPQTQKLQSNSQYQNNYDEKFDTMSQKSSTSTIRDFPTHGYDTEYQKQHSGRLCPFQSAQFELFEDYRFLEGQIRRWKLACIKGKAALIEKPDIQIGVTQSLVYNGLAQSMFLKAQLYFGNKTNQPLRGVSVYYEGDPSIHVWIKPEKLDQICPPGQQIKQEIISQITEPNFRLINGIYEYQTIDGNRNKGAFILPVSLVSFMDFKDIDNRLFRPKWKHQKKDMIRSAAFPLNPKIAKSIDQLRSLMPNMCELVPARNFINQLVKGSDFICYKMGIQMRWINLGGVFDLLDREFLIKIIIYPNMQCVLKLSSESKYAEQMLNSLVFVMGL